MPPIINKFKRAAPDSPTRCLSTATHEGQCPYEALEHSNYCARHGGNRSQESYHRQEKRRYRLNVLHEEYAHFVDDDKIKGLTEEIGLLRMLLQTHLDTISEPGDLLLISHKVSDLVKDISLLVTSCHKLDQSLGGLLDKAKIVAFAEEIVTIVSQEVQRLTPSVDSIPIDDVIDAVADRLVESCKRIALPSPE